MITEDGLIGINKRFANGNLINSSSIRFALSAIRTTKDWIKQAAYLIRAIALDHPFEEGNKRTAAALLIYFMEAHKVAYDPYKVDRLIAEIASKNIKGIEQIRRKIKDAIR